MVESSIVPFAMIRMFLVLVSKEVVIFYLKMYMFENVTKFGFLMKQALGNYYFFL